MTRSQLIRKVSTANPDLSQEDVRRIVEHFFAHIAECLTKRQHVALRNFGSFGVKNCKERIMRNPKTGRPIDVSARNLLFFKAGKTLKKFLNT